MKLKDIENLVGNFSNDVINDFQTSQEEFKSITVQQALKLIERRKMDTNLAKDKTFWDRFSHNIELLTLRFRSVLKEQGNNPKKEDRINQFFKYYDKEIK